MHKDRYDLEVNCASDAALQSFLAGVDCAVRFDHPGITELQKATSEDEDFALAHAMLGRQLQIHGFNSEVRNHLDRSVALKASATKREQSTIDVIVAAASFDPRVLDLARSHVDEYPNDVIVLSHLVGPFGLLAFSGQRDWREQNMALLQATKAAYSDDDWWFLTACSFMEAESGDLRQARIDGERAWSLDENGNCAHSLAHVHFEAGALDEGATFINGWEAKHGDKSDMRHHLMWHLALLGRESGGDAGELLEMFARELDPSISDPMPLTTFSDNASLMWRCSLGGIEIPDSISHDLVRYADAHYPHRGFAFADIHRVMSVALANDREQRQGLVDELADLAQDSESEQARCVHQFAKAFNAFADQDYRLAASLLEPVVADSVLLGGSNPQRRIIEETWHEATRRCSW